jgi:AcrR family transcriptional regulator
MTTQELTEKCQAIMQASLKLIAEQGFHGTPMSQVASQADVGVGSIYRYFKDKDELIHALHAQLDGKLTAALATARTFEGPHKEKFVLMLTSLIKHFIDNPIEFKFMEQYYNSPYGVEKKRQKFFDEAEGDACGKPFQDLLSGDNIKDLPQPTLHALAFGPLLFSLRDHHAGLQELDGALINKIAEGCWDAVRKTE